VAISAPGRDPRPSTPAHRLAPHGTEVRPAATENPIRHELSCEIPNRTIMPPQVGQGPPPAHLLRVLRGHTMPIKCADMTAGGTRVVAGSRGRLLPLWDLDARECLQVLRGHRDSVYHSAITEDARLAVSASEDMTVRLWDLAQGKLLADDQHLRTIAIWLLKHPLIL
ncbi:MAG: hypothetical protein L0210_12490, partial [Rhodospirillales bacterium]|nr:hypothetical protein [Rhodospirillales bacterium]